MFNMWRDPSLSSSLWYIWDVWHVSTSNPFSVCGGLARHAETRQAPVSFIQISNSFTLGMSSVLALSFWSVVMTWSDRIRQISRRATTQQNEVFLLPMCQSRSSTKPLSILWIDCSQHKRYSYTAASWEFKSEGFANILRNVSRGLKRSSSYRFLMDFLIIFFCVYVRVCVCVRVGCVDIKGHIILSHVWNSYCSIYFFWMNIHTPWNVLLQTRPDVLPFQNIVDLVRAFSDRIFFSVHESIVGWSPGYCCCLVRPHVDVDLQL